MAKENLLELFGMVLLGKFHQQPTKHQMPGKHFYGSHAMPRPDPVQAIALVGDPPEDQPVVDANGAPVMAPKVTYIPKHRPAGTKLYRKFYGKNTEA